MTDPDGTARHSADAQRWAVLHADDLVGRPLAEADTAIRGAGLQTKVVRPGAATTLEFRAGRVTVTVDDQERVTALHAG